MKDSSLLLNKIIIALPLCIFSIIAMRYCNFFSSPKSSPKTIAFKHLIAIFSLYLFFPQFIQYPLLVLLSSLLNLAKDSIELIFWLNSCTALLIFHALLLYTYLFLPEFIPSCSWEKIKAPLFNGFLTFFFVFPFILLIHSGSQYIVNYFYPLESFKQSAVSYFESSMLDSWLLFLTTVQIAILVPLIEEFVYRIYLQGSLVGLLGIRSGIILSSLIFALCHYSPAQDHSNFSIILTLFVFSLFLAWLYHKNNNVLASFILHCLLNTSTVLSLIFSNT